jgi:hypothetical protein
MISARTSLLNFLLNDGFKIAPEKLASEKCSDAHTHQKQTKRN